MANTFIAIAAGIPFTATNTSMLALFNGAGSGVILRVYRCWVENSSQDTAFTGTQGLLSFNRITAATASNWTIPPIPLDSSNTALPAQVICGSKFTVTTSDLFRRVPWSTDEPTIVGGTIDELQTMNSFMYLWDTGYNDANIEPLVCREGQGVSVQNISFTATAPANAGYLDAYIEFTST